LLRCFGGGGGGEHGIIRDCRRMKLLSTGLSDAA
jgi:hypothetical protein